MPIRTPVSTLSLFSLLPLLAAPAFAAAPQTTLLPGDATNGGKLYQAKCQACHVSLAGSDGSKLHTRENRKVKTVEGLIGQVKACNNQLDAGLSGAQINDIVAFLNERYYRFK